MNGHGGARKGAGRKEKPKKAVNKVIAEAILSDVNEKGLWTNLLHATRSVPTKDDGWIEVPDYDIRLKALIYLTNRRDGTPPQSVQITGEDGGPIEHCIRFVSAHEKPHP